MGRPLQYIVLSLQEDFTAKFCTNGAFLILRSLFWYMYTECTKFTSGSGIWFFYSQYCGMQFSMILRRVQGCRLYTVYATSWFTYYRSAAHVWGVGKSPRNLLQLKRKFAHFGDNVRNLVEIFILRNSEVLQNYKNVIKISAKNLILPGNVLY
jgi:hypothetical protein